MIESVKVGPFEYSVRIIADTALMSDHGGIDHDKLQICVNGNQAPLLVLETLLHEVEHAINNLCDITDSTPEEDSVRRSTPIRLQVYRENPAIVHAIIKGALCDTSNS